MATGKSKVREYTEAIVLAVILALFIRAFIVQAFKIPSGSMIPTLLVGDHILVNKFIYGVRIPFTDSKVLTFKEPQRGDVIVFIYPEDPSKDFIKRVVGLPGDTVQIKGKDVYINGEHYKDPHARFRRNDHFRGVDWRYGKKPTVVPQDSLFVLGDNRDNSKDSRYWGFVPIESVRGKAFMIYFSNGSTVNRTPWNIPAKLFDAFRFNRWDRMGNVIH
jgi:signal peptidase I